jgi:hypothetical protein
MTEAFLAIAFPISAAHVGGGPVYPGAPGDPGYGQGHPVPPHIGGGPIYRPPHVGGGPAADPGLPPHVGGGPAHPPGQTKPGEGDGAVVMPPVHYPPTVWPPGAPIDPASDFLVMVWVPNVGLTWVAVDKDLMPSNSLPEPPAHVGGGPAPTPAPK